MTFEEAIVDAVDREYAGIQACKGRALLCMFYGPPPPELVRQVERLEAWANGGPDDPLKPE